MGEERKGKRIFYALPPKVKSVQWKPCSDETAAEQNYLLEHTSWTDRKATKTSAVPQLLSKETSQNLN